LGTFALSLSLQQFRGANCYSPLLEKQVQHDEVFQVVGRNMKHIRLIALIVALPFSLAYAQQEVDPDHFDANAARPAVHKTQHVQHESAAQANHHVRLAHSRKAHGHHGHVSA